MFEYTLMNILLFVVIGVPVFIVLTGLAWGIGVSIYELLLKDIFENSHDLHHKAAH